MTKRSSYNGVIKDTFREGGKKREKVEPVRDEDQGPVISRARRGVGGTMSPSVGGQLNTEPVTVPFKTNM